LTSAKHLAFSTNHLADTDKTRNIINNNKQNEHTTNTCRLQNPQQMKLNIIERPFMASMYKKDEAHHTALRVCRQT